MDNLQDKKLKLQQKSQANLQRFIQAGFNMVEEARDIEERIKEIEEQEKKDYSEPCYRCKKWPCDCKEGPLMEKKDAKK